MFQSAGIAPRANDQGDAFVLDAILITAGIVVIACSLFYKLLLLLYQADQRAAERRREKSLRDDRPGWF
ncbi:hypothetical protein BamIOP4010DRAFT_5777 [Burkholderia ambifaria IOP40-10]|jgi:hypothetical protein|uniref:Uncharacterized protein n=1 Tax=Burkholderia ambifaria IOP40-10 TaxID=396596 RepID=B1FP16_9BURK|nr:hypothetical protein [Burkholderia ambifaria]EDT00705.1 hypothetical protein BamIOP4010DRAFT_5777 [Burkholderia ambifaria IOP40-10]